MSSNDKVKNIIVDKLGVDESRVVAEASFLDDLGAVLIYGFLFFSLGMHVAINPDIYFYKDSLPEILIPYDIFFFYPLGFSLFKTFFQFFTNG